MEKVTSKKGTILKRDLIQGILMTFLGGFVTTILSIINSVFVMYTSSGDFSVNWKYVLLGSLAAGASHVYRKYIQDENGKVKIFKKWVV